jgi:hypothetical protein
MAPHARPGSSSELTKHPGYETIPHESTGTGVLTELTKHPMEHLFGSGGIGPGRDPHDKEFRKSPNARAGRVRKVLASRLSTST